MRKGARKIPESTVVGGKRDQKFDTKNVRYPNATPVSTNPSGRIQQANPRSPPNKISLRTALSDPKEAENQRVRTAQYNQNIVRNPKIPFSIPIVEL